MHFKPNITRYFKQADHGFWFLFPNRVYFSSFPSPENGPLFYSTHSRQLLIHLPSHFLSLMQSPSGPLVHLLVWSLCSALGATQEFLPCKLSGYCVFVPSPHWDEKSDFLIRCSIVIYPCLPPSRRLVLTSWASIFTPRERWMCYPSIPQPTMQDAHYAAPRHRTIRCRTIRHGRESS